MLIMSKHEYYKKHADYRSMINGKPYLLTLNKLTGKTILAPVLFTSSSTMHTI
jgi:hypothetical protein